MGLLDDAIRDHLELKRLRGADPGEVAREQDEALTPVLADEAAAAEGEPLLVLEDFDVEAGAAGGPERAHGGEETAELDMQTVLGEEAAPSAQSAPETAGVAPPAPQLPPVEGSVQGTPEWEVLEDPASATPANPDPTTIL